MFVFDLETVVALQRWAQSTSFGTGVAIVCAQYLILILVAIIGALFFSVQRAIRMLAVQAALAAGLALVLVSIIGHFAQRTRPYLATSTVHLLIGAPLKTSFPSGHTSTAFAMAFILTLAGPRVGIVAFICAAFIAVGRMAVGVHYPTDVIGGVLVGLLSAIVVRVIYRDIWEPRRAKTKV